MRLSRLVIPVLLFAAPALAGSPIIQGGPVTPNHVLMYSPGSGSFQAIVQDAGNAGGGSVGVNPSEIGVTQSGTAHGPNGEPFCVYDGPTTSGYHALCLGPNVSSTGLISYGAYGGATAQPLHIDVNGATQAIVAGPLSSTIGHQACFGDTAGSTLTDCQTVTTYAPATKTGATYTMTATDGSLIINSGGTFTLTLLSAASYPGRWIYLKTIAAQAVNSASANVVPLASATPGTAILAATAGKWVQMQSDGTNWIVMAGN